ncbi:MAG TPA: HAD-IIA family hydrolase [Devosia sp.]|nr:HAD-IIA family hydrolase [Devosia sp.]
MTRAAGFLVDLDGTLISGNLVLPDANWLLAHAADRYMLVSNNSEHTPELLCRHLRRMGLPVHPDRIVLAGTSAIDLIALNHPGASLLLLGSPALRNYAKRQGLRMDGTSYDVVLVARDRHFSYVRLARAAEALSKGARLYVACPDRSHPGSHGQPVPEAGALAAAVMAAAGVTEHVCVGKPEPLLFEAACTRLGIAPRDAIMIGDNADTDGEGARRLGMHFVHVRNGDIRSGFQANLKIAV